MPTLFMTIMQVLWLFLPAGIANTGPVFAARFGWLKFLDRPLDQERTWRGRRLLGVNKTIRGLVIGVIFGLVTGYIQHLLFRFELIRNIALISYEDVAVALAWGGLLGFGALLGDAVKSFFKRQRGIAAGKTWQPFDQIDLILGALLVSWWIVPLTMTQLVIAIFLTYFLSLSVSWLGVKLKIKQSL